MKNLTKYLFLGAAALLTAACSDDNGGGGGQERPYDGPTFELSCSDVTATSAMLSIVPSDDTVGYYFDVIPAEEYAAVGGNVTEWARDLILYYFQNYPMLPVEVILEGLLSYGADSDTVEGLEPDSKYYAYAIAIDSQGNPCSKPVVADFTTEAPGDPKDCGFDFKMERILSNSATIVVRPSDTSTRYWYSIEEVDGWQGDAAIPGLVKMTIDTYAQSAGMPVENVVKGVTFRGESSERWDVMPNTSYYAYAFAVDAEGNICPDCMLYKERFKTPEYDISQAEVSLTYRYFDGDELYAANATKYPNARGKVLLQVEATPNEEAADWLVAFGSGDMTDPSIYPDSQTIQAMLQGGGQRSRKVSQFWIDGWKIGTLMSFGVDAYGLNGTLYRKLLDMKKEGASPVSQVKDPSSVAATGAALEVAARPATGLRMPPLRDRTGQRTTVGRLFAEK